MKVIIGLGNPGEKYKNTRHNVGFMVVNALAEQQSLTWQYNKKFNAEIAQIKDVGRPIGHPTSKDIILVKPQTFVNNSGQAVQKILSYYKLLPKTLGLITAKNSDLLNILTVIHDDLDIELGKYKIALDSRSAGHKGVDSIINYLKTKNFQRIRIGIRTGMTDKMPADQPRQERVEASKFVLQKFSEEEINIINNLIPQIINELNRKSN